MRSTQCTDVFSHCRRGFSPGSLPHLHSVWLIWQANCSSWRAQPFLHLEKLIPKGEADAVNGNDVNCSARKAYHIWCHHSLGNTVSWRIGHISQDRWGSLGMHPGITFQKTLELNLAAEYQLVWNNWKIQTLTNKQQQQLASYCRLQKLRTTSAGDAGQMSSWLKMKEIVLNNTLSLTQSGEQLIRKVSISFTKENVLTLDEHSM